MEQDPSFHDSLDALELRVLSGPQAGARAPLAAGQVCTLAAGPVSEDADIALRDENGPPVRVRIVADDGVALVAVIEGLVQLGEQTLAPGDSHDWPMHAPLRVGGSVLAFGLASVEAWPSDAATRPIDDGGSEAAPQRERPRKRRATPWLAGAFVTIALVGAGVFGFEHFHTLSAPATPRAKEVSLEEALRTSGFADLTATLDAYGRLEVKGRLGKLAQRSELEHWLAQRKYKPLVSVIVDEDLARDVTDVFRVNGIAVQARVQASGHIVAEASEADAQRLSRAEEVVRRDVRGLVKLGVVNKAPPAAPPPPAPMVDDPGKRIASVVPGNPAYLVTADGSRYFIGAMLPTGHRIAAIAGQHVLLERDGQKITLNL